MALGAKSGGGAVELLYEPKLLLDAQRRGFEAFVKAGQIVAEGYRACTERQLELAQAATREMWTDLEKVTTGQARDMQTGELVERMRVGFERTAASAKELSDILLKAQGQALTVLNACVTDTLDDMVKASRTVVEAANESVVSKAPVQPVPAVQPVVAEAEKPAEDTARKLKRAGGGEAAA